MYFANFANFAIMVRLYTTPKYVAPLSHVTFVMARPTYRALNVLLFIMPYMLPICVHRRYVQYICAGCSLPSC